MAAAAADESAVEAAEEALLNWTQFISTTLQSESGKVAASGGPMCEIDFWRARHAVSHPPKVGSLLCRVKMTHINFIPKLHPHCLLRYQHFLLK